MTSIPLAIAVGNSIRLQIAWRSGEHITGCHLFWPCGAFLSWPMWNGVLREGLNTLFSQSMWNLPAAGIMYPEWTRKWEVYEEELSADLSVVGPLLAAAGAEQLVGAE